MSGKGLVLLAGGIFQFINRRMEIHHKISGDEEDVENNKPKAKISFTSILIQIALLDLVFSFDSILTAMGGLAKEIMPIITAVIISMIIMMQFTQPISRIVHKHPTLQILALSFLILIGVTLIMEGLGREIEKSFIYVSVAFSFIVELLNIRFRTKNKSITFKTISNLYFSFLFKKMKQKLLIIVLFCCVPAEPLPSADVSTKNGFISKFVEKLLCRKTRNGFTGRNGHQRNTKTIEFHIPYI